MTKHCQSCETDRTTTRPFYRFLAPVLSATGIIMIVAVPLSGQAPVPAANGRSTTSPPAATLPAAAEETSPDIVQALNSSKVAIDAGQFAEARQILHQAAKNHASDLRILTQLAFAYERSAEAARVNESDPKATKTAADYLDQAVDIYMEAAAIAVTQKHLSVAEQIYTRVLMYRPATSKAILALARIMAATDRKIQGIDRYKDYLKTPDGREDGTAYLELGWLYLDANLWRQATDALARAQKYSPQNPDIDMALARAYQKNERMPEALAAAQSAIQKQPRRAEFRDTMADLYLAAGEQEKACDEARLAIKVTRDALQKSAIDLDSLRKLSKYYDTYRRALNASLATSKIPTAIRIDLAKAIAEHAKLSRTITLSEALQVLQEIPADKRNDVLVLEALAEVHQGMGHTDEAAAICRRLLDMDADNAAAKRILQELAASK